MSSGAGHVGHALMASHTVLSRLYKHFDTRHHLSHIARQNLQGLIPADATPFRALSQVSGKHAIGG